MPFEPDGVYNGIPYRVLPDCSVEAMLSRGWVRFRTMDDLIASTGAAAGARAARASSIAVVGDTEHGGVPANPLDYHSILARAIAAAHRISAKLRAFVYERARFNLKREFLFGYSSLGLTDMMRHVNEFEQAVARLEAEANRQEELPPARETAPRPMPPRYFAGLPATAEPPASPSPQAVQILPPQPVAPIYSGPKRPQRTESFQLTRIADEFARHARFANKTIAVALVSIAFIGAVIIAILWPSHRNPARVEVAANPATAEGAAVHGDGEAGKPAAMAERLPFPIPSTFGVYVLSDNKLTELQSLAMAIPDPRVKLSAEITKPSAITISDNKPSFILFRRDLLNSAPQKITLRLIARVARQTKFVGGKAETTNIEGAWRIRDISRDLKLAPVPGQREMIMAQLDDDTTLVPGRYAMVLNRVGYDFAVAGDSRSAAFCLEEFEAANGTVFSQCHTPK
jgi:hypothetical protein